MPREPQNRDRDDHKIQTPLQDNLVTDNGGEEEDIDPKIHCLEDLSPSPHLTQSAYEESLMDIQLNELSKGDKTIDNQNRYNLRSKNKGAKPYVPEQSTRTDKLANDVASKNKERKAQNSPLVAKSPIP